VHNTGRGGGQAFVSHAIALLFTNVPEWQSLHSHTGIESVITTINLINEAFYNVIFHGFTALESCSR